MPTRLDDPFATNAKSTEERVGEEAYLRALILNRVFGGGIAEYLDACPKAALPPCTSRTNYDAPDFVATKWSGRRQKHADDFENIMSQRVVVSPKSKEMACSLPSGADRFEMLSTARQREPRGYDGTNRMPKDVFAKPPGTQFKPAAPWKNFIKRPEYSVGLSLEHDDAEHCLIRPQARELPQAFKMQEEDWRLKTWVNEFLNSQAAGEEYVIPYEEHSKWALGIWNHILKTNQIRAGGSGLLSTKEVAESYHFYEAVRSIVAPNTAGCSNTMTSYFRVPFDAVAVWKCIQGKHENDDEKLFRFGDWELWLAELRRRRRDPVVLVRMFSPNTWDVLTKDAFRIMYEYLAAGAFRVVDWHSDWDLMVSNMQHVFNEFDRQKFTPQTTQIEHFANWLRETKNPVFVQPAPTIVGEPDTREQPETPPPTLDEAGEPDRRRQSETPPTILDGAGEPDASEH